LYENFIAKFDSNKIHNMETDKTIITVETFVNAPIDKVWECWTHPEHIVNWNFASADWHAPKAENDLRPGGSFTSRMEAKDGSYGFDFEGVYDDVIINNLISYTLGDGRTVVIKFTNTGNETHIAESFEAEDVNPEEMQRDGWQAILNNFKKYAENV
jgi:uncharacterized protein YndB with AHSA1/START domain